MTTRFPASSSGHKTSAALSRTAATLAALATSFLLLGSCGSGSSLVLHDAAMNAGSPASNGRGAGGGEPGVIGGAASGTMAIDGSPADWPLDRTILDRGDSFNYHAMADEDHLYLYIEIISPFHQYAIRNSGFTVYLSDDAKNKRRRGVSWPSGSFNLLRDDPSFYDEILRDEEWLKSPDSNDLLKEMHREIYDVATLSERPNPKERSQYVNFPIGAVRSEGTLIAMDTTRRVMSFEWKIPLDGSAPFQISRRTLEIGFAIEPPRFVFMDSGNDQRMLGQSAYGQDYYRYGRSPRNMSLAAGGQSQAVRRALGEYEKWFTVSFPR